MTAPTIVVDVSGVVKKLDAVARAAIDLSPVLGGPINEDVNTLFKEQFDSEGAAGGTKWAPLAPVTVLLRGRRGHGRGGIGRDTNRMWASLTKLGLGPDAIRVITKDSLERGTKLSYATWFHGGYRSRTFIVIAANGSVIPLRRRTPKTIPPRPLVPEVIPVSHTNRWETFIARFLENAA